MLQENDRVRFKDHWGMGKYLRLEAGQPGQVISVAGPGVAVRFDDGQTRTLWAECLEHETETKTQPAD
jgi:hypothetical protein